MSLEDLLQLYLAEIFSEKHPPLLTMYFTNAIASILKSTPAGSQPSFPELLMFTNLLYIPSWCRYPISYFYHTSLSIRYYLKLTAGWGTGRRKPESFCFMQILLGSKYAAAVWQGIHIKLVALLPYGAKSPRKSSQGHRSFAINLSEIGVGVE